MLVKLFLRGLWQLCRSLRFDLKQCSTLIILAFVVSLICLHRRIRALVRRLWPTRTIWWISCDIHSWCTTSLCNLRSLSSWGVAAIQSTWLVRIVAFESRSASPRRPTAIGGHTGPPGVFLCCRSSFCLLRCASSAGCFLRARSCLLSPPALVGIRQWAFRRRRGRRTVCAGWYLIVGPLLARILCIWRRLFVDSKRRRR